MKKGDALLAVKLEKRDKGGESGNPSKAENSFFPKTEQAFRAGYRSQKN